MFDAPVQLVCVYCGLTHSVVGIVNFCLYVAIPVPVCAFVSPYFAPAPQSNVILYLRAVHTESTAIDSEGFTLVPVYVFLMVFVVVSEPLIPYPSLHVTLQRY